MEFYEQSVIRRLGNTLREFPEKDRQRLRHNIYKDIETKLEDSLYIATMDKGVGSVLAYRAIPDTGRTSRITQDIGGLKQPS